MAAVTRKCLIGFDDPSTLGNGNGIIAPVEEVEIVDASRRVAHSLPAVRRFPAFRLCVPILSSWVVATCVQ